MFISALIFKYFQNILNWSIKRKIIDENIRWSIVRTTEKEIRKMITDLLEASEWVAHISKNLYIRPNSILETFTYRYVHMYRNKWKEIHTALFKYTDTQMCVYINTRTDTNTYTKCTYTHE